jgi:hypothetical protein
MSRCATTPRSAVAILYASMPMSTRRVTAFGASLVCSVESTRWPVSDACTAICAVSWSRISPTSTTSGSCRRIERSADAKVRPAFSFVCTCTMFSPSRYSTGSSTVTMFTPSLLHHAERRVERRRLARARGAGDEDDAFLVRRAACRSASRSSSDMPSESSDSTVAFAFSTRMTTFSPCVAGSVEMRRSTGSAVHRDAGAAVLRPATVGDVEPRHDLDARDERHARRCAGSS